MYRKRRLYRELSDLSANKFEDFSFEQDSNNIVICDFTGPEDSLYAGEKFKLQFFLKDYPDEPPILKFYPPNIPEHQNIRDGEFCFRCFLGGHACGPEIYHINFGIRQICLAVMNMLRSITVRSEKSSFIKTFEDSEKMLNKELSDLKREKHKYLDFEYDIGGKNMSSVYWNIVGYPTFAGDSFRLKFSFSKCYPYTAPTVTFVPPNIPRHKYISEDGCVMLTYLNNERCLINPGIRNMCSDVLTILRTARKNNMNWIPEEPPVLSRVDPSYEVFNGLSGANRDVLRRLCFVIFARSGMSVACKDALVCSLIGMCAEHVVWKNHPHFMPSRRRLVMELTVKDLCNNSIVVRVNRDDMVEDVTAHVLKWMKAERVRLYFEGRELKGDKSLADYKIRQNSVISAVCYLVN